MEANLKVNLTHHFKLAIVINLSQVFQMTKIDSKTDSKSMIKKFQNIALLRSLIDAILIFTERY